MAKINRVKTKAPLVILCNAIHHLMLHGRVLATSTDSLSRQKTQIVNTLITQIDSQQASLKTILEALNHVEDKDTLKKPRHSWDPRKPKSFTFFNELKVALSTLKSPKHLDKFIITKTPTLEHLDAQAWLEDKIKYKSMSDFEDYVNTHDFKNKDMLLPKWLKYCGYSKNGIPDDRPYWKSDSFSRDIHGQPTIKLTYSKTAKGDLQHYNGMSFRYQKRIEDYSFTFNLMQLLQYKDGEIGDDCFGHEGFDLILKQLPENQRLPILMKTNKYNRT